MTFATGIEATLGKDEVANVLSFIASLSRAEHGIARLRLPNSSSCSDKARTRALWARTQRCERACHSITDAYQRFKWHPQAQSLAKLQKLGHERAEGLVGGRTADAAYVEVRSLLGGIVRAF